MSEKRMRDRIEYVESSEDITAKLRSVSEAIANSAHWIKEHRPRDERHLALFNLLVAAIPYVDLYAQNLSGPLPVLALCTRAAFELDLRLRHVLRSSDNLEKWKAEFADDYLELLEAAICLGEPGDPRARMLQAERDRIEGLRLKHKLPGLKRVDTLVRTLAREVGVEKEYESLFKIFSKLVHPTSYLVNKGAVVNDSDMRNLLLTRLQLYVLDLLKRATDEMGVPPELTAHCLSAGAKATPDVPHGQIH